MFLNADFEEILRHFNKSTQYKFYELSGKTHKFDYAPGTVRLQVFNWLSGCALTGMGLNRNDEERRHFERQNKDYNLTIMLHPYQEKKIEGVDWRRGIAIVIDNICRFAMNKGIPLCLPDSVGTDFLEPYDYSRIVYFPDSFM
ncbi:MAG: hypothetical protein Q8N63_00770 [Nanoarchaeota archaeon]|nr:hypothetical protein [Nanoarchaeota archaeon]